MTTEVEAQVLSYMAQLSSGGMPDTAIRQAAEHSMQLLEHAIEMVVGDSTQMTTEEANITGASLMMAAVRLSASIEGTGL